MKFSDFVRFIFTDKRMEIKEVSRLMGYTEPSFRNKLTKGNFSLKDALVVGLLTDLQLAYVDESGNVKYRFDPLDSLQPKDFETLKSFINVKLQRKEVAKWFSSLPEDEKLKIYEAYNKDESGKKVVRLFSKNEGYSFLSGLRKNYLIIGKEHEQALQFAMEYRNKTPIKTQSQENKLIYLLMSKFDIIIRDEPKE